MRTRPDGVVHDQVFRLVLGLVESKGLPRGKVAGMDSTYLRAAASMKSIVRKDTGDDYASYLKKLPAAIVLVCIALRRGHGLVRLHILTHGREAGR